MTKIEEFGTDLDKVYPYLVNDVLKYIEKIKQIDKTVAIIDIIMDYSRHNDIDYEMIGDAIASDVYLKSFIEKDCQVNHIHGFESNHDMGEW